MKKQKEYRETLIQYLKIQLPKVLSLLDREIYSETYGCFDREFWHYKSKGYFNGMIQCYLYSLALFYKKKFRGNYLYQNKKTKKYIIAALNFSVNHCHRDGSFDEHYYNEHSVAATSFILFSITETVILLDLDHKPFIDYFRKTSKFLLENNEKYVRANHIACTLLGFYNLYLITGEETYQKNARKLFNDLMKTWSEEGWFKEYKGCDPGYNTLTLYYLTKYAQKTSSIKVVEIIRKSISFCSYFMHPDYSYGGYYGSRNTMHFFPYAFEYIQTKNDYGKKMVNSFVKSISSGNSELLLDDRFSFLHINNVLEILENFREKRISQPFKGISTSKYFPEAGIYVYKNKNNRYQSILNCRKGGIIYIFKKRKLALRICSIILKTNYGIFKSSNYENVNYEKTEEGFLIRGKFSLPNKFKRFNPLTSVLFKVFSLTLGYLKIFRDILKRYLIQKMILNRVKTLVHFSLNIKFGDKIKLNYCIMKEDSKIEIFDVILSSLFSDIYVPSSKIFQIHDIVGKDLRLKDITKKKYTKDSIKFSLII
ncbi:MAG: hypothetical protein ACOC1K_06100 [Nanoarchaeota archaeon]